MRHSRLVTELAGRARTYMLALSRDSRLLLGEAVQFQISSNSAPLIREPRSNILPFP